MTGKGDLSPRAAAERAARRVFLTATAVAALLVAGATLFRLGDTPPGLYIDEVAISLTARSLWETGRDLAGNEGPLYPYSFPDRARPMPVNPIYTYSAIPFALFGPSAWWARLPSVLWLWACAAGIAFLASELTGDRAVGIAIGATAALSPWLFVLGRIGWEAASFPALTALAFGSLLRGVRTGSGRAFAVSGTLFGLSIYAYSTARLLVPLTVAALALVYARRPGARRHAWRFALPLAILAVPIGVYLLRHPGVITWRFEREMVFRDETGTVSGLTRFLHNYARYFSPRFLFIHGDSNLRHGTGRGVLLWIWGPLITLGVWQAWRLRREPAVQALAAALAVAPAAAALMINGQPHAIRSITAVVFWAAVAALGLQQFLRAIPRSRSTALLLCACALLDFGLFAGDYFGAYRERALDDFDSGRGAALREAFRIRGGRPLYVPPDLHSEPRNGVFVAYWGALPVAEWTEKGADAFGVHAWLGVAPPGSLIVADRRGPLPASGARLVFPSTISERARFALYEVPSLAR